MYIQLDTLQRVIKVIVRYLSRGPMRGGIVPGPGPRKAGDRY